MELMRRRGMMELPSSAPVETWDFEWDYTMGLPENNGMTKDTTGSQSVTMTAEGLKVTTNRPSSGNAYVRYTIPTTTMTTGVAELRFLSYLRTTADNTQQNVRLIASNGVNGGSTLMNSGYFRVMDAERSSDCTTIATYSGGGTEYTERIVLKGNTFDVYLNGALVVQDHSCSNILYATANRVFVQNTGNGNYAILKSIRYKFNRIV